jgi:hypothetical protein
MLSRTNYFLGAIATFLQSSVQGIDRQTSLGIGLGRYLKNTNRFRFWVLAGAGWQKTTYTPSIINQPHQNIGVALVSSDLQAFAFKKTRLDITSTVFPAMGGQKGRVFYKATCDVLYQALRQSRLEPVVLWELGYASAAHVFGQRLRQ